MSTCLLLLSTPLNVNVLLCVSGSVIIAFVVSIGGGGGGVDVFAHVTVNSLLMLVYGVFGHMWKRSPCFAPNTISSVAPHTGHLFVNCGTSVWIVFYEHVSVFESNFK